MSAGYRLNFVERLAWCHLGECFTWILVRLGSDLSDLPVSGRSAVAAVGWGTGGTVRSSPR